MEWERDREHPVFVKVPANWSELTREQKKEWALGFLRAAKEAAGEEDQQQRDGSQS